MWSLTCALSAIPQPHPDTNTSPEKLKENTHYQYVYQLIFCQLAAWLIKWLFQHLPSQCPTNVSYITSFLHITQSIRKKEKNVFTTEKGKQSRKYVNGKATFPTVHVTARMCVSAKACAYTNRKTHTNMNMSHTCIHTGFSFQALHPTQSSYKYLPVSPEYQSLNKNPPDRCKHADTQGAWTALVKQGMPTTWGGSTLNLDDHHQIKSITPTCKHTSDTKRLDLTRVYLTEPSPMRMWSATDWQGNK